MPYLGKINGEHIWTNDNNDAVVRVEYDSEMKLLSLRLTIAGAELFLDELIGNEDALRQFLLNAGFSEVDVQNIIGGTPQ